MRGDSEIPKCRVAGVVHIRIDVLKLQGVDFVLVEGSAGRWRQLSTKLRKAERREGFLVSLFPWFVPRLDKFRAFYTYHTYFHCISTGCPGHHTPHGTVLAV